MTKEEAIEIIEDRNFSCIECIDRREDCCKALDMASQALSAECFTLEELKSWLWSIALNNSDNSFGDSVENLIGRLDGFKNFVKDSRMRGDNQ